MFECLQNWTYLCQKWSDFQSETTVGKLRTSPISSQKHGGALIRAGALNGDNTVIVFQSTLQCNLLSHWSSDNNGHCSGVQTVTCITSQINGFHNRSMKSCAKQAYITQENCPHVTYIYYNYNYTCPVIPFIDRYFAEWITSPGRTFSARKKYFIGIIEYSTEKYFKEYEYLKPTLRLLAGE